MNMIGRRQEDVSIVGWAGMKIVGIKLI